MKGTTLCFAIAALACSARSGSTQTAPTIGSSALDDTPSVKVGGTLYSDFTYTREPSGVDADGNRIHPSAFDVRRAYINVTGNVSHLFAFRITPDVAPHQETSTSGLAPAEKVSSNLDGSLTVRLKYGFGQLNLDDWLAKGSWIRLGLQQTPYLDYTEAIYRYRFQGTLFAEREGFLGSDSSDLGLSGHYSVPGDYGDVHVGVYNGDTYTKSDANDQKAFEVRATLRPAPGHGVLKGLRFTGFRKTDHYVKNGRRDRLVGSVTFEHAHLNVGFEYLDAKDRRSASQPEVHAHGWSAWATPRSTIGIEGLLRYDTLEPDARVDGKKNRTLLGVAYWLPVQKGVAAAALWDYEKVTYDRLLNRPDEQRYSLHLLVNF